MISELAKLRDFAASYTAAWCSRNASSVAAFYSQDGLLSVNRGTPAVGRKAITDGGARIYVQLSRAASASGRPRQVEPVGYHWTLIGTNKAPEGQASRGAISMAPLTNISEHSIARLIARLI
jgi:hypothetical protein